MTQKHEYEVWLGPDDFSVTASDIDAAVEKARERAQNEDRVFDVQEVSGVYVLDGPEDNYVKHEDPKRFSSGSED